MIYILECMISILFVLIDEPLSTTGKPATINDIGVGFLGLLVIVAIVWFIVYCLRFFVNNKKIKNNLERFQDEKKERIFNFWGGILYYLECYILLFLYFIRGKNLLMKTTGVKPTKNDIAISIIWWIYTGLIIMSISFIRI